MAAKFTDCMECGAEAKLVGGNRIYPHRPDLYAKNFWLCDCGAYVGCHPGTKNPLGRPAGAETRKARSAAHAAFDPLWKSRRMSRSDAYRWLAQKMGTPPGETHISWMNAEQARQAAKHCAALAKAAGEEAS